MEHHFDQRVPYSGSGFTAVRKCIHGFANAIAYIESAIAAGLDVTRSRPGLSFFFNAHMDFLTEIAKFRASRRLYARLMRERFGRRMNGPACCGSMPRTADRA